MKLLITENQYDKISKIIQNFLNGMNYENVDRIEVISPEDGIMYPSINIYFNYRGKRLRRQEVDDVANDIWQEIYTIFNIPMSIYIYFV